MIDQDTLGSNVPLNDQLGPAVPEHDIDLGDGHWLKWYAWAPDRSIQNNAERFADVPDCEKFGAAVPHRKTDGELCEGFVTLNGDVQQRVHPKVPKWTVGSWEPLTLSPSLLCRACGDHGFVRDGKWWRA